MPKTTANQKEEHRASEPTKSSQSYKQGVGVEDKRPLSSEQKMQRGIIEESIRHQADLPLLIKGSGVKFFDRPTPTFPSAMVRSIYPMPSKSSAPTSSPNSLESSSSLPPFSSTLASTSSPSEEPLPLLKEPKHSAPTSSPFSLESSSSLPLFSSTLASTSSPSEEPLPLLKKHKHSAPTSSPFSLESSSLLPPFSSTLASTSSPSKAESSLATPTSLGTSGLHFGIEYPMTPAHTKTDRPFPEKSDIRAHLKEEDYTRLGVEIEPGMALRFHPDYYGYLDNLTNQTLATYYVKNKPYFEFMLDDIREEGDRVSAQIEYRSLPLEFEDYKPKLNQIMKDMNKAFSSFIKQNTVLPPTLPGSDRPSLEIAEPSSRIAKPLSETEKSLSETERSDIERGESDIEREESDIEREESDIEREEPDIEREESDIEREESDIERGESDIEREESDIERGESDIEREESDIEREEPDIEREESDIERGEPLSGTAALSSGIAALSSEVTGWVPTDLMYKVPLPKKSKKSKKFKKSKKSKKFKKSKKKGKQRRCWDERVELVGACRDPKIQHATLSIEIEAYCKLPIQDQEILYPDGVGARSENDFLQKMLDGIKVKALGESTGAGYAQSTISSTMHSVKKKGDDEKKALKKIIDTSASSTMHSVKKKGDDEKKALKKIIDTSALSTMHSVKKKGDDEKKALKKIIDTSASSTMHSVKKKDEDEKEDLKKIIDASASGRSSAKVTIKSPIESILAADSKLTSPPRDPHLKEVVVDSKHRYPLMNLADGVKKIRQKGKFPTMQGDDGIGYHAIAEKLQPPLIDSKSGKLRILVEHRDSPLLNATRLAVTPTVIWPLDAQKRAAKQMDKLRTPSDSSLKKKE